MVYEFFPFHILILQMFFIIHNFINIAVLNTALPVAFVGAGFIPARKTLYAAIRAGVKPAPTFYLFWHRS